MDGTDAYVGMLIQFRSDYGDEPAAAIVTDVGTDRISCSVFHEGFAQADCKNGVMHSTHPDAKRQVEINEDGGIWDYAYSKGPAEIDKSQEKPRRGRPKAEPAETV